MKRNYGFTITSCFTGYIVQAITVNFPPLLFVIFMDIYSITLGQISALITLTFVIQLLIDLSMAKLLTSENVRKFAVTAQFSAVTGLVCLSVLPEIMPDKFVALLISAVFYSAGSGLIEVVISPIVEACPTKNKSAMMSLLHSFYSWGSALTIGLSTLFFAIFGVENWRILALILAAIPFSDGIAMTFMPICGIGSESGEASKPLRHRSFILMMILMFAGGAMELAISQWASTFAETGLNISKSAGDIAGPFMFAILMGTGRVMFTVLGKKIRLINYMLISAVIGIAGYAMSALSSNPVIALAGIGVCGFAVAIFWPGTLSLATSRIGASAQAFGLLAFCGDLGCTVGPATVGYISQFFGNRISTGILAATVFPITVLILVIILKYRKRV